MKRWKSTKIARLFVVGCAVFVCMSLHLYFRLQGTQTETTATDAQHFGRPDPDGYLSPTKDTTSSSGLEQKIAPEKGHVFTTTRTGRGKRIPRNATRPTRHKLEQLSSVDYFACCGAGHRLSKLVDANYLAKRLKFGLRVFFGFCGAQETFSYFFGPQPESELQALYYTTSSKDKGRMLKISNDVVGFHKIQRSGPETECVCPPDRFKEDATFYRSIRSRYRAKDKVKDFLERHFQGHTIIGIHIRAGNGEVGDFTTKNRTINDPSWAFSMTDRLVELAEDFREPSVLFIATDTPKMITLFRTLLKGKMEVIEMQQARLNEGDGVQFGQDFSNKAEEDDSCLGGWEAAFSDMMILSHADVVIAARPSSFTQSIPMTVVLDRPKSERKVLRSFCEVSFDASKIRCYEDAIDWCCNGTTSFSFGSMPPYEYRRMPDDDFAQSENMLERIQQRPTATNICIPTPTYSQRDCLPYDMPDGDHVVELGSLFQRQ